MKTRRSVSNSMEYCEHEKEIVAVMPSADGCEECLKTGGWWVHLRFCQTCGHVGCCDNGPNRHATKHYHANLHPTIKSFEPGENWGFCYPDDRFWERLPEVGRTTQL